MIRILDTYPAVQALFAAGTFHKKQWKAYVAQVSTSLPRKVLKTSRKYAYKKQMLPVLENLFAHPKAAEAAHQGFLRAAAGLEEKCACLPSPVDCTVIFYLGLCCGAGWATDLDGQPAILLGIEKIVELGWTSEADMAALLYHELGHLWHFQNRSVKNHIRTKKDKALWQLYTEGVAMYAEQLLCGDAQFYHQDRDGWLDWCTENRSRLAKIFLHRLQRGESVQDFFGDWESLEGHADVGYFLGCETVRLIQKRLCTADLLNLQLHAFEPYLKELAHTPQ